MTHNCFDNFSRTSEPRFVTEVSARAGGCGLSVGLALGCFALSTSLAVADDWSQWLGPPRDAVGREAGIMEAAPDSWRGLAAAKYLLVLCLRLA